MFSRFSTWATEGFEKYKPWSDSTSSAPCFLAMQLAHARMQIYWEFHDSHFGSADFSGKMPRALKQLEREPCLEDKFVEAFLKEQVLKEARALYKQTFDFLQVSFSLQVQFLKVMYCFDRGGIQLCKSSQ